MKRVREKTWRNTSWSQVWRSVLRGLPEWKLRYGGRPNARCYVAEGGPFNGHILKLVDGTTAALRVGNQRGRYRCAIVGGKRWSGTTKWIPAEGV